MLLKNSFSSLLFVLLFVSQQIVSYCFIEVNIFSPYWLMVFSLVIFLGLKLPLTNKRFKLEKRYLLMFVVCSFLTFMNGHSLVSCAAKGFFILYGYVAYVYVRSKKINTNYFTILLIVLYVFFNSIYFFQLSKVGHGEFEGDLFGHSSSNAIPICLNTVLFFFLIIHEYYHENKYRTLLVLSLINIILIYIQQSRAGIIVSISIFFVIVYLWQTSKGKNILYRHVVVAVFIALILSWFYYNKDTLPLEELGFGATIDETYTSDIRHYAQVAFFANLDISSFLFGYPPLSIFEGMGRTYNSLIDIWLKYGIIPFVVLILLLIKRIIMSSKYSISPIVIIPVLLYSTVESIYAGSLWDEVWFFILFLSYENNKYSKKNCSYSTVNKTKKSFENSKVSL